MIYLDDGIVAAKGFEAGNRASLIVRNDLQRAGLVVNVQKSIWLPAQALTWLGFDLNLSQGVVSVPTSKIDNLRGLLMSLAKQIASVVGKIIFMSIALGPVARLMTRSLYSLLNSRHSWFETLCITPEAGEELQFWYESITTYRSQNIWKSPSAMRVVYSDASGTGFGGYTVEHGPQVAHGQWSDWEAHQSLTWRELKAVLNVLQSFATQLQCERVRWFTDNQNVVRIVLNGSKMLVLQKLALEVFQMCVVHNITIEPEWIPSHYISKTVHYDDWMLHPVIFAQLDSLWGPHSVDRFANLHNRQIERFNSRFWTPETEAVDTFTVDWGNENNWWCPHLFNTKATGTLIVPCWPSAPFWPLLFPEGGLPAEFHSTS